MWRDTIRLGQASFRGVPFSTADVDARVGRRNVVHEYPGRDIPFVEDLGRRARVFTVEGYVVGDDYLDRRDRLTRAFEEAGPGELMHPRWGQLTVSVQGDVSMRESPREGGIARFQVTFVESGENTFPQARENTVAEVDAAAEELEEAAEVDFADQFSIAGASVLGESALTAVAGNLRNLVATVRRVADVSAVVDIVRQVDGISNSITTLLRTPADFVHSLRSIQASLTLSVIRPLGAISDFEQTFGLNGRGGSIAVLSTALPGSTRARRTRNQLALADLQRRCALPAQARFLSVALQPSPPPAGRRVTRKASATRITPREAPIDTAHKAVQLRDRLLAQIDTELEDNDPPAAVATALIRLRAAVTRDVSQRVEQLRLRSTFTPAAVLPSLVIAHRVYQDARRSDELVMRNAVPHPAFVPAVPLEILQ